MSKIPDYFAPHDGDAWELQELRSIGDRYWRELAEVAKGIAGARIEDINSIRLSAIQTSGRRRSIITRPPYRLQDGAEGFAYARYLVEHYQDCLSAEWREVRAHLDRLHADQKRLADAPLAQQARDHSKAQKERASKPRSIIPPLVERLAQNHPDLSHKQLWSRLITALGDDGHDPEEATNGLKLQYWVGDQKRTLAFGRFQNILSDFTTKKK